MKKTTRHDWLKKKKKNIINYKSNCIICMELEWYDLLSVLKPPIPSEVPVKIVHFWPFGQTFVCALSKLTFFLITSRLELQMLLLMWADEKMRDFFSRKEVLILKGWEKYSMV